MGFLKTLLFITAPIAGLTVAAFRLNKQLPRASRLFGNYIGLSYIYFKSILKYIKPVDQMPFQMINLARKTTQQSQALRRQLKSTIKRVKQDINTKREETFQKLQEQTHMKNIRSDFQFLKGSESKEQGINKQLNPGNGNGNSMIYQIMKQRQQLIQLKKAKEKGRKFFEQL